MKPLTLTAAVLGLCLIRPFGALAQFSSGSTGADGALDVTTSTNLDLPPNGIFNFTTITVAPGATLRFNRNALNTPAYMLATGDVTILGLIDVSGEGPTGLLGGRGGPGGFDGGYGASQGFPAGDGQGPGGGRANPHENAVFSEVDGSNTNVYGNTLLSPLIGGSGGSGGVQGGGGGGGAILIASSTKVTVDGNILSSGGFPSSGNGSSGAIRIVAPIVSGSGSLEVGQTSSGRTRIDSTDRFAHRTLRLTGKGTRGSQMFVFPPGNPKLDIVNAAGTQIPEGTSTPVTVNLPVGSSTDQIIRVQARNFTNDVPIRVKITPENAASATFDGVIAQTSGSPPFADIQVTLPLDTVCYVHAWTR
jgi:hypothetical protein